MSGWRRPASRSHSAASIRPTGKLAGGSFRGAPILPIHGMLFFAWTLFLAAQTTLVATRCTPNRWRTRGRPHREYVIGGALLLAVQLLSVPIGASATWLSIARWFESLAR